MDSLRWVDHTYVQKHKSDNPQDLRSMYYPNLQLYESHGPADNKEKTPLRQAITLFAYKYGRKGAISLTVLALSYIPYVGRFVLPAASFYTFSGAVGPQPALIIFPAWQNVISTQQPCADTHHAAPVRVQNTITRCTSPCTSAHQTSHECCISSGTCVPPQVD